MADRASPAQSRIPVPMKSPPPPRDCVKDLSSFNAVAGETIFYAETNPLPRHNNENGSVGLKQSEKGSYEKCVMTGDIIIQTNKTFTGHNEDNFKKTVKESQIPKLSEWKNVPSEITATVPASPKHYSKIPAPIKGHHQGQPDFGLSVESPVNTVINCLTFPVQAPVAEMEELSDLSNSSCSDSEPEPADSLVSSLPGKQDSVTVSSPMLNEHRSKLDEAVTSLDMLPRLPGCDDISAYPEPLSSGDSGFVHDGHNSDSDLTDRTSSAGLEKSPICQYPVSVTDRNGFVSEEILIEKEDVSGSSSCSMSTCPGRPMSSTVVASPSGEKFMLEVADRPLVRTSKSHENYLQAVTNSIAVVNIDIDENLAYSLDTLTYNDSSETSLENMTQVTRSLHNSPEKKLDKVASGDFMPGSMSLENSKQVKLKLKQREEQMDTLNESSTEDILKTAVELDHSGNALKHAFSPVNSQKPIELMDDDCDDTFDDSRMGDVGPRNFELTVLSDDSDGDSIYHQPNKSVDRPSALRLAKRLFELDGFRKSDVSRHLCKKNDFSNLVACEYLKFFDFSDDTLDAALRRFLTHFSLFGETQERERVLAHFSARFIQCNPGSFNSEDACHTLTCAIMLLHSDLHARNVRRRMTCQEFIENLSGLNDGDNFPKEVLKAIYQAIKTGSIEWAVDEDLQKPEGQPNGEQQITTTSIPQSLGSNPFLDVPDPNMAQEYKRGYVMRKCCLDPDSRKTPFGKRGWKMMYAVLRDMILYHYKDERHFTKGQYVESSNNAIRIHHALATKATDYTKKQHVFRLQTADWAEFLFQTGNPKELQEWVDTINMVAASLSAPPLPGAVGSRAKFQRPLLPATLTKLNLREQLHHHEVKVEEFERELREHQTSIPEKGSKGSLIQDFVDKETYLEFEVKRFNTYALLLRDKLSVFPELEPSLVETTIGEYEEMGAGPSSNLLNHPAGLTHIPSNNMAAMSNRPVQRSLSDSGEIPNAGMSNCVTFGVGTSSCGMSSGQTSTEESIINDQTECTHM